MMRSYEKLFGKHVFGLAVLCGVAGMPSFVHAAQPSHVVNPGTTAWAEAARTGRADLLIMGDSVTWFQGRGWDQGITKAAAASVGLAGTGLIGDSGATGQGYGFSTYGAKFFNNGWDSSLDAVPAARQGYAPRVGLTATAGATPLNGFSYGVDGMTLDPSAAYDWSLYTASPTGGGGAMGALRRVATANASYSYNVLQTKSSVATATPADGLQKTVFQFAATPSVASDIPQEFQLRDVTNTSVLYSRLTRPGATGVTVSSLGYGGRPTKDFYNNVWSGDAAGRAEYLSNVVDGGSGKLNVMITEGFNDRGDDTASINGVGPGSSAEGFADNVSSLIARVRSDWAADGHAASDLSFTLVGMYADQYDDLPVNPLFTFSEAERALAEADPQISFVDLFNAAPGYDEAVALGYMFDDTHPSWTGAQAYSEIIFNAIAVPEPTGLALAGVAMVAFARRPRRV
jgi:hypothetical protein